MKIECPHCASKLNAADILAGKTVPCPQCKLPVTIPAPTQRPAKSDPMKERSQAKTRVACSACQAKIMVPNKMLGKTAKCPKCAMAIKLAPDRTGTLRTPKNSPTNESPLKQKQNDTPITQESAPPPSLTIKPIKRNQTSILIGLGGFTALLLMVGLAWWLMPGPQRTTPLKQLSSTPPSPSNESTEIAELIEPANAKPENLLPPPFNLAFDFGPPESKTAYDFEFKYSRPGMDDNLITGKSIYQMKYQESDFAPRGKYGNRLADPLPLEEVATGLGIPGKRVIVSYVAARDAEDIKIKIGSQTFNAEVIEEHPDDGFLVLDYSGPNFAPPKVARKDEVFGQLNTIRVNPNGDTQLLENFDSWQRGGPWKVVLKRVPQPWKTGLVFQHWGSIVGILTQQKETNGIVNINRITKHFDNTTFDFEPPAAPPEHARDQKHNSKEFSPGKR